MTSRIYIPKDSTALALGAEKVARAFAEAIARRGARPRSSAPARAASTGWSRWSKSSATAPASAMARSTPEDADGVLTPMLGDGAHPKALGPRRGDRLSEAAAAADLRALRRDRPAVARRLSSRTAAARACGARSRSAPAATVKEVLELGPARPRRRGLPDRHQVAHRRRRRGRPEIRRLQRRRGRQRHLRRPHADGGRPVPADRGHDHRRPRGRRDQGLRLHPLRISARLRDVHAPRSRSRAPGRLARRQRARLRQGLRSRGAARRRRLHLRRGDLAAGKPRGQARPGARQAAAAGDCRACSASRPSSTTC